MPIKSNVPFIICCKDLPLNEFGIALNYELVPIHSKNWSYVDVRNEISANEHEWLEEIQNWHHNLSKYFSNISELWWLCPGSRLVFWESYHAISFAPLLFFLGAISIYKKNYKNIVILNAPYEVQELLRGWLLSKRINNGVDGNPKTSIVFDRLISCQKYVKNLFFNTAKVVMAKINSVPDDSTCSELIIISTAFNIDQVKKLGDHYFGRYFDFLSKEDQSNMLWTYLDSGGDRKFPESEMKLHKANYCFLNSFINYSDIVLSFFKTIFVSLLFFLNKSNAPRLAINEDDLSKFSNIFINRLVFEHSIFDGLINFYKIRNLLNIHSNAKYIFYPYEEQISERALLLAVKNNSSRIKSFGFSHASLNQGHLYLKRPILDFYPRPDIVLTTSNRISEYLKNNNVPRKYIYSIGSPRYSEPIGISKKIAKNGKIKILAIFSFGFEFKLFAQLLIQYKYDLTKYEIRLRGSFHSWKEEEKQCHDILKLNNIQYITANGNLESETLEADIVIFDISTAGLQASLLGKYVIRIALSQSMHTKHLFDLDNQNYISYRLNLESLLSDIDEYLLLDEVSQLKIKLLQRDEAIKIISPPLPFILKSLIEERIN